MLHSEYEINICILLCIKTFVWVYAEYKRDSLEKICQRISVIAI